MSLVKLAPGIASITGKFGGQFFKKYSDGQHIVAPPRNIKKTATNKQKDQRDWYSSKKYAEHYPYPDEGFPDDEIPPGTHVVYSLETLWAHRNPSLTQPTQTACDTAGFWPNEIEKWIQIVWQSGWSEWGLTKDIMFTLTLKWFYIGKSIYNYSNAVSFTMAKANMMNWIAASAAAVAVPLLGLWIGLVGLGFFFGFLAWLEGDDGNVSFTRGRIIVRKDTSIWFGGLVGRPSKKMYDFAVCSPTVFEGSIHKVTPAPHPYKLHWFYLDSLWQSVSYRLFWYYVYTWTLCRCRFRGMAYKISGNRLRMQVSESQHDYWDTSIGSYQSNADACSYIYDFDDHFSYSGHPADPL